MKRIGKITAWVCLAALLFAGMKNEYARLLPASSYGMQAAVRKGKVSHLFIGSSMFRQGLSIDVLEEELEGNVYILSYNGNQPAFMAMELNYMLEEGLEIENLYVDLYPYTAAALPWISDTKILLDTDLAFKWEAWKLMDTQSNGKFSDFYELFVTANNEQLLTYPLNNRLVSAQFRNGGNVLRPAGQTREHLYSLEMLGGRDGLQPAQLEGYQKLLGLAQEHGIRVWFLETPKYERMYRDEDYLELYEACVRALEEMPGESRMVLAEELDFDTSDPACFQDLIHLSAKGREVYTRMLCERGLLHP